MIEIERIDPARPSSSRTDPGAARRDRGGCAAELGIEADAPVIGTVSVLRPQKALDVLVRAASSSSTVPGLRVLIAGEGTGASSSRT